MCIICYNVANTFLTPDQQSLIVAAIQEAELNTSGEIRLHIEPHCPGDAYERAKVVFGSLGMHATALQNGVLFYLAYADKKFAIVGDKGIHERVSQQFWDEEKQLLLTFFRKGEFAEGLCEAIKQAGEKLKQYFPRDNNDTNELSNDISFGGESNE